jgi:hypothetical protein
VHGACWHGAVPSTNASRLETKVMEAPLNPAGTGPPEGGLMPAFGASAGREVDWEGSGDQDGPGGWGDWGAGIG